MSSINVEAALIDVLDLETDIASVASKAAAELDDKLLARNGNHPLTALQKLSHILESSVANVTDPTKPSSALNPTTAVLLRRAIPGGHEINRLEELLFKARKLTERLAATATEAASEPLELAALRDFCVDLSRHALAMRRSPLERPGHPFRH